MWVESGYLGPVGKGDYISIKHVAKKTTFRNIAGI